MRRSRSPTGIRLVIAGCCAVVVVLLVVQVTSHVRSVLDRGSGTSLDDVYNQSRAGAAGTASGLKAEAQRLTPRGATIATNAGTDEGCRSYTQEIPHGDTFAESRYPVDCHYRWDILFAGTGNPLADYMQAVQVARGTGYGDAGSPCDPSDSTTATGYVDSQHLGHGNGDWDTTLIFVGLAGTMPLTPTPLVSDTNTKDSSRYVYGFELTSTYFTGSCTACTHPSHGPGPPTEGDTVGSTSSTPWAAVSPDHAPSPDNTPTPTPIQVVCPPSRATPSDGTVQGTVYEVIIPGTVPVPGAGQTPVPLPSPFPVSGVRVSFVDSGGHATVLASQTDGSYSVVLPPGSYTATIGPTPAGIVRNVTNRLTITAGTVTKLDMTFAISRA